MAALKTFRFDLDFDDPKYNVDISEVDEKQVDLENDWNTSSLISDSRQLD